MYIQAIDQATSFGILISTLLVRELFPSENTNSSTHQAKPSSPAIDFEFFFVMRKLPRQNELRQGTIEHKIACHHQEMENGSILNPIRFPGHTDNNDVIVHCDYYERRVSAYFRGLYSRTPLANCTILCTALLADISWRFFTAAVACTTCTTSQSGTNRDLELL